MVKSYNRVESSHSKAMPAEIVSQAFLVRQATRHASTPASKRWFPMDRLSTPPGFSNSGKISAANEELEWESTTVNSDPYGEGWIVRFTPDDPEQTVIILDAAAYRGKIEATD